MFDWFSSFWGMVYLAIGFSILVVHFGGPMLLNDERFGWWVNDEDSIIYKIVMSAIMFAVIVLLWWAWLIFLVCIGISVHRAKVRREEIFKKHSRTPSN